MKVAFFQNLVVMVFLLYAIGLALWLKEYSIVISGSFMFLLEVLLTIKIYKLMKN